MADDPKKPEETTESTPAAEEKPKKAPAKKKAEPKADAKKAEAKPTEDKPKRAPAKKKAEETKAEAEAEEKPKRTRAKKAEAADKPAEAEAPKAATEEPKAPKKEAAELRRKGARQNGAAPVVVRAQAKYVRSSARKARLVCDQIRGKTVPEARALLAYSPRDVAEAWTKLLDSAVANAENNHDLVGDELKVLAVYADEGPTIKRFRPRAMGRATRIRKRTSHLTIQLTPKETR
jgi:ribosomal protein L22